MAGAAKGAENAGAAVEAEAAEAIVAGETSAAEAGDAEAWTNVVAATDLFYFVRDSGQLHPYHF